MSRVNGGARKQKSVGYVDERCWLLKRRGAVQGPFTGPQMREFLEEDDFLDSEVLVKQDRWKAFKPLEEVFDQIVQMYELPSKPSQARQGSKTASGGRSAGNGGDHYATTPSPTAAAGATGWVSRSSSDLENFPASGGWAHGGVELPSSPRVGGDGNAEDWAAAVQGTAGPGAGISATASGTNSNLARPSGPPPGLAPKPAPLAAAAAAAPATQQPLAPAAAPRQPAAPGWPSGVPPAPQQPAAPGWPWGAAPVPSQPAAQGWPALAAAAAAPQQPAQPLWQQQPPAPRPPRAAQPSYHPPGVGVPQQAQQAWPAVGPAPMQQYRPPQQWQQPTLSTPQQAHHAGLVPSVTPAPREGGYQGAAAAAGLESQLLGLSLTPSPLQHSQFPAAVPAPPPSYASVPPPAVAGVPAHAPRPGRPSYRPPLFTSSSRQAPAQPSQPPAGIAPTAAPVPASPPPGFSSTAPPGLGPPASSGAPPPGFANTAHASAPPPPLAAPSGFGGSAQPASSSSDQQPGASAGDKPAFASWSAMQAAKRAAAPAAGLVTGQGTLSAAMPGKAPAAMTWSQAQAARRAAAQAQAPGQGQAPPTASCAQQAPTAAAPAAMPQQGRAVGDNGSLAALHATLFPPEKPPSPKTAAPTPVPAPAARAGRTPRGPVAAAPGPTAPSAAPAAAAAPGPACLACSGGKPCNMWLPCGHMGHCCGCLPDSLSVEERLAAAPSCLVCGRAASRYLRVYR